MKYTWCQREVSDHAMVTVRVDFETIDRGHGIFKCPSELHLDVSYQNIIHSTIRKWLIDSQPESEERQRLKSVFETKLSIEYTLAQLRQEAEDNEVTMGVLQSGAETLAHKLPDIDDLVDMATVVSKKALHEFLLVKCKEQTIEFTKKFKLRGNAPTINKLKAKLTRVIDEGGSSEEIMDIESQMRELVDEDIRNQLEYSLEIIRILKILQGEVNQLHTAKF